jgi:hypothetical protein
MNFLRKMFGRSRDEIWRQLSAEIDGRFEERPWMRDKVEGSHGPWTVTLDKAEVSSGKTREIYTRMRAPFVNPQGFRFTIYRKGFSSDLGEWLGMQDVEVGLLGESEPIE